MSETRPMIISFLAFLSHHTPLSCVVLCLVIGIRFFLQNRDIFCIVYWERAYMHTYTYKYNFPWYILYILARTYILYTLITYPHPHTHAHTRIYLFFFYFTDLHLSTHIDLCISFYYYSYFEKFPSMSDITHSATLTEWEKTKNERKIV